MSHCVLGIHRRAKTDIEKIIARHIKAMTTPGQSSQTADGDLAAIVALGRAYASLVAGHTYRFDEATLSEYIEAKFDPEEVLRDRNGNFAQYYFFEIFGFRFTIFMNSHGSVRSGILFFVQELENLSNIGVTRALKVSDKRRRLLLAHSVADL